MAKGTGVTQERTINLEENTMSNITVATAKVHLSVHSLSLSRPC